MKKVLIIIACSICTICITSYFILSKGILQYYRVVSSENEPSVLSGSLVFGTNQIPPKKYKLIVYEQDKLKHKKGNWIHRLCGTEYDRLQIRNGDLYVNDTLIDKQLTLKHLYLIDTHFKNYLQKKSVIQESEIYAIKEDTFLVNLSQQELVKGFYYKKYISDSYNDTITARFNQLWNEDNFGPVTVPLNHVFVLGDNRNNSIDSRFIGFIHKSKIKGVVLGYK